MNKYDDIIDKIISIIEEDKKQTEYILRYDLSRFLEDELNSIIRNAYDDGYTDGKNEREDF